ncbi:ABC transporter ATP-binding protein [uncultured Castellaniella sp.]|uniref:ABC transporter ATP-binding protein n=1 Tax=uncultured Castellaniella sp. TaxID=647907 RepID=UPI00260C0E0B|nr:ABC transporter ATP-binding protein [uncultured Castellaniella sp.]
MIRLENLTKTFTTHEGTATAADHISMEVAAGEICILLGPSGCGKTTTLKMVNRIIPPSSGRVFLDEKDTTDYDTISLRRQIGYVIQQIGLFPNMTVGENIGVVPRLLGWDKRRIQQRTEALLEMVALDPAVFLARYPKELSGGQQQRIGVARALAADPPVLLMDEPFGAIDPINRQVIQDEFLKMQEKLGKTILFVSHDIDEAVKMGDKIAIFREGRLQQFDTPNNVLARPANDFVANFVGCDRTLKRLRLMTVRDVMTAIPAGNNDGRHRDARSDTPERQVHEDDDLRMAVSQMFTHNLDELAVVDHAGQYRGTITQQAIRQALSQDGGPVHQNTQAKHPVTCESQRLAP